MSQSKKEQNTIDSFEFIESIKYDDFAKLALNDTDTSDTGSNVDENDYLSEEEFTNNYSFLQKPKKKFRNQYKEQFKTKTKIEKELQEEDYVSD
jgi:hypothetical protein